MSVPVSYLYVGKKLTSPSAKPWNTWATQRVGMNHTGVHLWTIIIVQDTLVREYTGTSGRHALTHPSLCVGFAVGPSSSTPPSRSGMCMFHREYAVLLRVVHSVYIVIIVAYTRLGSYTREQLFHLWSSAINAIIEVPFRIMQESMSGRVWSQLKL